MRHIIHTQISVSVPPRVASRDKLVGDLNRLKQVLQNFLSNGLSVLVLVLVLVLE